MKTFMMSVAMLIAWATIPLKAQTQQADTVIVPLGNSSKVIFITNDREDLKTLRQYDFQELFNDVFDKIESADSTAVNSAETASNDQHVSQPESNDQHDGDYEETHDSDDEDDDDGNSDGDGNNNNERRHDRHYGKIGHTWQSTNVDFGLNNYLQNGKFPHGNENYAVRPWGSWYVGINSVQSTRMAKNFFLEWGLGVSWYNFKFQEDNIQVRKEPNAVQFLQNPSTNADFIKSKLSVSYINASLVPVFDLGGRGRKHRVWDRDNSEFRFGIGPYAGYKIGSRNKEVYEENGKRKKDITREDFYLNEIRYGIRAQLGIRSTDFFFNYDLNELFKTNYGPKLQAISFGVIF